jgi:hypothetical protein
LILELLKPDSCQFFNWVRLYNPDVLAHRTMLSLAPKAIPIALYYASLQGLPEVCDVMLRSKAVDINAVGGQLRSAFYAAMTRRHGSVVQLLIEKGMRPESLFPFLEAPRRSPRSQSMFRSYNLPTPSSQDGD